MDEGLNLHQLIESARHKEVDVDIFKFLYMVWKERAVTESEVMQYDVTDLFWKGLGGKLKNGELIVVTIRGEVRTGKSTVGLKVKSEINKTIFKLGKRKSPVDEFRLIMADQTEFVRFIKKDEKQLCILIDEYSAMAEGGANASTEQQILQTQGDIFAADYIHRINCNPTRMTDTNSFIHLQVEGKNIQKGFVKCKLVYYNHIENDQQTLGHVNIVVGDMIKNWLEHVQVFFEGQEKVTEKEQALIDEWSKKDWYIRYMVKKKRRRDLMKKYGIRDVRDLEFSTVVIGVYKELYELAEVSKVKPDLIVTTIQDVCRREGKIYSMYAELIVMTKVKSLLGLITDIRNYEKKLRKPKLSQIERTSIVIGLRKAGEIFKRRLHEEARLCYLYDEYLEIEG